MTERQPEQVPPGHDPEGPGNSENAPGQQRAPGQDPDGPPGQQKPRPNNDLPDEEEQP